MEPRTATAPQMEVLVSRERALRDFFEAWEVPPHLKAAELVSLDDAAGRIAACDVFSSTTLPVVRASGFDGVGVRSSDFEAGSPDTTGWICGRDFVRADTGDDFPDEFDAVVRIESVVLSDEGAPSFPSDLRVKAGDGIRAAGSTMRPGIRLIAEGTPIRPTDLAALAMGGAGMVPVRRKPRVAFIPTGSELVPAGCSVKRGQTIDGNSPMVKHLLIEYGADPVMFPIVEDDPDKLREALDRALESCDAVVVNGGSAVGSEDFNVRIIEERGRVVHHYIAAVPGRPMLLGVIEGKPVIDLPGPAVAAFYGMQWCIQSVTARMLGTKTKTLPRVTARVEERRDNPPFMANLSRIELHRDGREFVARFLDPRKGSSLGAALASNAQRVSPLGEGALEAGSTIEVELLRGEEFIGES